MILSDTHPMLDRRLWDASDVTRDETLLIVDGPAIKMHVAGGTRNRETRKVTGQSLVIVDGPRDDPRTRYVHSAPRTVKHIVVLCPRGSLSADAQKFCLDNEITWAWIDPMGKTPRTLSTSGYKADNILKRKLAMCAEGFPLEHVGLEIIRGFISAKLEGQAWNAENKLSNPALAKAIRARIDSVEVMDNLDSIEGHEGNAADAYWQAWRGLTPRWHKIGVILKPLWLSYPGRKSKRRKETNRRATDPINAMLNFAYHAAETECIIALQAAGLDPDMGISHVDKAGRASFALDLIEVIRPAVDEIILELLKESLDPRFFATTRDGVVSVTAPLTHRISADVRGKSHLLEPYVRRVKEMLISATV